jgi:hypothetical protein
MGNEMQEDSMFELKGYLAQAKLSKLILNFYANKMGAMGAGYLA